MTLSKQIRPFHTVLVANRGEIAIRVLRTVRRMGYATVAVYSEADQDSLHVRAADRAVLIGAATPRESYLNISAIIEAAKKSGADAVHPGYGFLAENDAFADAVDRAGLVFVGPSGAVIRAMGNKAQAKLLVMGAGMPCIPGYQGKDQSDATFTSAAAEIGFPVMVKATAGGGGRGMRLVHEASALLAALASARSEARQAFGSDELILERALAAPRHVEIQILADSHGHVIHLGERDCSVQRRHQKVIEEAPSPAVNAILRARMGEDATRVAQAIGYIGAGTMEFLLDQNQQFYFMEMNTRLQVEHAVTEAITGLDLVEWQLRVAAGERLTLQQADVKFQGHAIEVRLTAEDVPSGFLPQIGPVLRWRPPTAGACHDAASSFDVRVDHGLIEGGTVSPHYDSMVAKIVAHGNTREEARRKLQRAMEHCVLLGLPSNQGFLVDCLTDPVFADGLQVHTGFVQNRFGERLAERAMPSPRTLVFASFGAIALELPSPPATDLLASAQAMAIAIAIDIPVPTLGTGAGYITLAYGGAMWRVQVQAVRGEGNAWQVSLCRVDEQVAEDPNKAAGDTALPVLHKLTLRNPRWDGPDRTSFTAECDGMVEHGVIATQGDALHLFHSRRAWAFERVNERKRRQTVGGSGAVTAPLTGRIVEVFVHEGDTVQAGQRLVVLEAMKMEHTLTAPLAGRVAELCIQTGGQSTKGTLMLRIEAAP